MNSKISSTGQKKKLIEISSEATDQLDIDIVVGKDILELLSTSMYLDPLTIYREYIQNAADAIDDAVEDNILSSRSEGSIQVKLDHLDRRVLIHDNGVGVPNNEFESRLTSFGSSKKRGTQSRGFRGVGRLAGLGYCQELIFRSRSMGDETVKEIRWDCRKLKTMLSDTESSIGLEELILSIASIKNKIIADAPEHFFEVEIIKPRRLGNDLLMNEARIVDYISEIAPVPMFGDFPFENKISKFFESKSLYLGEYAIFLNDGDENQIFRPFKKKIEYHESRFGTFEEIEFFEIEGVDSNTAAIGWVAHHDYQGAIPYSQKIRGLKVRIGNIQIGGSRLFADIFPEERFNSWAVGEFHILDSRIVPNGRRDEFELNTHYLNFRSHLLPIVNDVARRCRNQSGIRNRIKDITSGETRITEAIEIIKTGAISKSYIKILEKEALVRLGEIRKASQHDLFQNTLKNELADRVKALEQAINSLALNRSKNKTKSSFNASEQRIIDLIYQCSVNKIVADVLVQRIRDALSK